jgi:hypothetical protein
LGESPYDEKRPMKIRKETLPKIGLTLLLIVAIAALALTVNRWLPRLLALF